MKIRISHIEASSHVDGPGERVVLFLQGCTLRCPGCQNAHLQTSEGGRMEDTAVLAETLARLAARHGNVTISGGEPFQQPKAVAILTASLRDLGVNNIIVYSGYTWDEIFMRSEWLWCMSVLDTIDTLVDGRFVASEDNPVIAWRGSANQRPIDVPASRAAGRIVLHEWWDNPVVIIPVNGDILYPTGLSGMFDGETSVPTRRCGETETQ